jgi:hypothetical protein
MGIRALENDAFAGDLIEIRREPALRPEKSHAIRTSRIERDQNYVRTLIFWRSRRERSSGAVPTEEEKNKERKYEPPTHHRE